MRLFAVVLLTVCQFTAVPFLSMVAANTSRSMAADGSSLADQHVTVVYKSSAS